MSKPIIDIQTIKTLEENIKILFEGALGAMTLRTLFLVSSSCHQ